MNEHQIISYKDQQTLYADRFSSFRACVEQAIADGVSLRHADLSHRNLAHAQLDGGDFHGTRFTNSNLSGANASECILTKAQFTGAILHGTVFCESDLSLAHFDGALFGGTDLFNCRAAQCVFTTLSAFSLNFFEAISMHDSQFLNPCGTSCPMSHPPLVIQGLQQTVIFMDRHIKIGHAVFESGQAGQHGFSTALDPARIRLRLEQYAAFRCMPDKAHLTFHK